MDLRSGTSSQTEEPVPLRSVPDVAADAWSAALEHAGDVEDVREDLALLRDAATLVTARQRLDGLLLQLTVNRSTRPPTAASAPTSSVRVCWPWPRTSA